MNVIKKINVDGIEYDIQGNELTKVSYAELKAMRDNGELVEGHLYRITDYEFTTTQSNTKSAGHVFDIIVLATSANELSHIARAIAHEDDTYFEGNDLGAWELWYDLDNDAEKYAWADAENGRGVIYRMIDDRGNDCPYDFKNAKIFVSDLAIGAQTGWSLYTFAYVVDDVVYDGSVEKRAKYCHNNVMAPYEAVGVKQINENVLFATLFSSSIRCNTFEYGCYGNVLRAACYFNTFKRGCFDNVLTGSYGNTFGPYSNRNQLYHCDNNTFDREVGNNSLETANGNTLLVGSHGNYLKACYGCRFGTYMTDRTFSSLNNIAVTRHNEYYDDGLGQLVPVKHPDLSTQPSILPYKFMGQYVYEQLIYLGAGKEATMEKQLMFYDDVCASLGVTDPIVLKVEGFAYGRAAYVVYESGNPIPFEGDRVVGIPVDAKLSLVQTSETEVEKLRCYIKATRPSNMDGQYGSDEVELTYYVRIVFTSAPKDGAYYGYNEY